MEAICKASVADCEVESTVNDLFLVMTISLSSYITFQSRFHYGFGLNSTFTCIRNLENGINLHLVFVD